MIAIRAATLHDLPAILAITNDAIRHTTAIWSLRPTTLEARQDWFATRVAQNYPVLVALAGDAVAGFSSFGDFRPWDGYAGTVENSVYVGADHRGNGIGALLLAPLIERARAAGKHVMVAGVTADNAASLRLHAKFGFVECGRLREVGRKFDSWLDLVFLQLLLEA